MHVETLDAAHRQAVEDVLGTQLEQNQRLVISVAPPALPCSSQSLADWAGVYDGLTDDQVETIEISKTRANLTRSLP